MTELLKLVPRHLGQDHGFLGFELRCVPVTEGGALPPDEGGDPPTEDRPQHHLIVIPTSESNSRLRLVLVCRKIIILD